MNTAGELNRYIAIQANSIMNDKTSEVDSLLDELAAIEEKIDHLRSKANTARYAAGIGRSNETEGLPRPSLPQSSSTYASEAKKLDRLKDKAIKRRDAIKQRLESLGYEYEKDIE